MKTKQHIKKKAKIKYKARPMSMMKNKYIYNAEEENPSQL